MRIPGRFLSIVTFLTLSSVSTAGADQPVRVPTAQMAPIRTIVAAFNRGDLAPPSGTLLPDASVISDGVAPYYFQGTDAIARWWSTIVGGNDTKKRTAFLAAHVTQVLEEPAFAKTNGTSAYLVIPFSLTSTKNGLRQTRHFTWIIAERKSMQGWIVAGQAFR